MDHLEKKIKDAFKEKVQNEYPSSHLWKKIQSEIIQGSPKATHNRKNRFFYRQRLLVSGTSIGVIILLGLTIHCSGILNKPVPDNIVYGPYAQTNNTSDNENTAGEEILTARAIFPQPERIYINLPKSKENKHGENYVFYKETSLKNKVMEAVEQKLKEIKADFPIDMDVAQLEVDERHIREILEKQRALEVTFNDNSNVPIPGIAINGQNILCQKILIPLQGEYQGNFFIKSANDNEYKSGPLSGIKVDQDFLQTLKDITSPSEHLDQIDRLIVSNPLGDVEITKQEVIKQFVGLLKQPGSTISICPFDNHVYLLAGEEIIDEAYIAGDDCDPVLYHGQIRRLGDLKTAFNEEMAEKNNSLQFYKFIDQKKTDEELQSRINKEIRDMFEDSQSWKQNEFHDVFFKKIILASWNEIGMEPLTWLYNIADFLTTDELVSIMVSTEGLDGAYTQAYADILHKAYKNDEKKFIRALSRIPLHNAQKLVQLLVYELPDPASEMSSLAAILRDNPLLAREKIVVQAILDECHRLSGLLTNLTESQKPLPKLDRTNIDEVISTYIENSVAHRSRGGKPFEAHQLYGTEEVDGKTLAYIWSYYQEYYLDGQQLKEGGGASLPLVVILEKDNDGKYTVLGHRTPKDGGMYRPSIEELFPKEYHQKIFSRHSIQYLKPIVLEKAQTFFGIQAD